MRRTVPGLLLSLLLAACAPKVEDGVTQRVLTDAQTARAAVIHLVTRYGEVLDEAGSRPDSPAGGWEAVAGYLESAEGLAAREFLAQYSKPVPVDPAFERSREIDEVSRVTAELVTLALAPRGTWEGFVQETNGARARLDRAVAALESGTKSFILIGARHETNMKTAAYVETLARARAGLAAPEPGRGEEKKPQ